MTVHDVIPLLFDDGADAATVRRFRQNLGHGLRQAKAVAAASESTRQDLMRLFPKMDSGRAHVVYWGAPATPAQAGMADGVQTERVLVLGGGGAARKNMAGTLQMFAHVAKRQASALLTVIGATDAAERARLTAQAQALGLQDSVELCGFLPEIELDALYRSACCLVYLSLYEGFGLPPLEAMSRGLPVVASNRSSVPEVVGDAGLLVDPEDESQAAQAVLALLEQPALRKKLIQAGYLQARRFTWEKAATAMCELLESAVKG
jgi:glycosyltransferase involved in cell wall biosynthesis